MRVTPIFGLTRTDHIKKKDRRIPKDTYGARFVVSPAIYVPFNFQLRFPH